MQIPRETKDANFWDEWWKARHSKQRPDYVDYDMYPRGHQVPLGPRDDLSYLPQDNDNLVVSVMDEAGLRTILCAGNGVSQEPRALAAAGFDVTALDISPVAVDRAKSCTDDRGLDFCRPPVRRAGGRVEFVVGDLLDTTVCPGPFDVIIERRTVQWFGEQERDAALSALAARLNDPGILLSQCLDDAFPMELGWDQHRLGWFHASESWFRRNGWVIWDGARSTALVERVAWLVRSGSMKPPPRREKVG